MRITIICITLLLYSVALSAQERITLLFVGDLMQHQAQIDAARTSEGKYDYSPCFHLVREQISQADLAIGNLEVTLAGKPYRGFPNFSAPDEFLQSIKDAGFDVLLTANNHCLDRGKKGLERTLLMLDSLHILHTGTYKDIAQRKEHYPLFIYKKGFRIAFLNYTYGTNGLKATPPNIVNYIDKESILKDIRSAKARQPDAIIACMHWGEEYHSLPNREQRELTDWLIQQGVTHIIGSHPHVIQPMELITKGSRQHVVVYSLGNFISNMSAKNTDGGLIFTLQLEKWNLPRPIRPVFFSERYTIHPDSTPIPFPDCRVSSCGYNLVWTARPKVPREKNYILYPAHCPTNSLSPEIRKHLEIFTKNARSLLRQHNVGIYEAQK
ncbi:CapA family protein [Bacteroides zoogleoformans]|uniref:CapA family protein n=1 Tax=Bacteroides zoogleoformans TaxID=28119 RepID=UPI00248EED64|nr:CapA family protein [Bacteroides zoogleoformans]